MVLGTSNPVARSQVWGLLRLALTPGPSPNNRRGEPKLVLCRGSLHADLGLMDAVIVCAPLSCCWERGRG